MNKRLFPIIVFVLLLLSLSPNATRAVNPTLGILGDSNSDEYRANDCRACNTPYAATTLSWDEQLVNFRGIDLGVWGTYPEPRRSGYSYNWARSGAITCDMVSNGQYAGLAAQVSSGNVSYVIIAIGTNDFNTWNGTYAEIYNGTLTGDNLRFKKENIVNCITTSVNALQSAGNPKIILANIADPGNSPTFITTFPSATGRAIVTSTIQDINASLETLVTVKGLYLADIYDFGSELLPRIDPSGNLNVGGVLINTLSHNDSPYYLQLNDSVGHLGTVGSALYANVFITALNNAGLSIAPFNDSEILVNAGITIPSTPTSTPIPTSTNTTIPTNTLTPSYTPSPIPTSTNTDIPTDVPTGFPTLTSTPTFTPTFTATATGTATVTPTLTSTPTSTRTSTPTRTPTSTSTPTRTPTATPTTVCSSKSIRVTTRTNNASQIYNVFDGILENGGLATEVNSSRFTYSAGWIFYSNMGRNNSAVYVASSAGRTLNFTTSACSLVIWTYRNNQLGSFDVYVNNVLKVSYNGFSNAGNAFIDLSVPLQ